ncbi:MAG: hypothetical protein NZ739_08310 [Verrucomicrobiae bacterium]|nr:hypothetical protein [Verrucomicrobiae bacterium]MCX7723134.1 hypothetical protein [Verrucomicrobiae bacterium]MDW7980895.1 hypothetical protein [Verrucomicrobiales bacterium]
MNLKPYFAPVGQPWLRFPCTMRRHRRRAHTKHCKSASGQVLYALLAGAAEFSLRITTAAHASDGWVEAFLFDRSKMQTCGNTQAQGFNTGDAPDSGASGTRQACP